MKFSLHPAVVAAIVAIVVEDTLFLFWRYSEGVNTGSGRLQSDLKLDAAGKQAAQNPEQFQKSLEESIKRDRERKGKP
jgi:hypothetical protein